MELDEFLAVGSFQILEVHRVMSMVHLSIKTRFDLVVALNCEMASDHEE